MNEPAIAAGGKHIAVLDGLRGIAILWVVWFHFYGFSLLVPAFNLYGLRVDFSFIPQSGFLGVVLFFFISGFVLFYPYARTLFEGNPEQTLKQFAYRRAIKIIPSYYLSLLLLVGLGHWLFFPPKDTPWQTLMHIFFIHNFTTNTLMGINAVYWSLAVEVQFYLLFPAICFLFYRKPWLTAVIMCGVAVIYRWWSSSCCSQIDQYLEYQVPAYLDVFASGMLCAYSFVRIRAKKPEWANRSDWATVIALIFVVLLTVFVRNNYAPYWMSSAPNHPEYFLYLSLMFFGVALSSMFASPIWRRLLANPILLFFAVISYNLYLYHVILAASMMYRLKLPHYTTIEPRSDPIWQMTFTTVAFIVVVAFSTLVTYAIERPILKNGLKV